jgi:hypothetical protein
MAQNGDKARSAAFSPSGEHLAVGMYSGGLKVLEFHPALAQVKAGGVGGWGVGGGGGQQQVGASSVWCKRDWS